MLRTKAFGVRCACFAVLLSLFAAAQTQNSGLLAHDINGFCLDMTVEQVTAVAGKPLQVLGRGQYEATVNGIGYDFGFSVLGHLYRIDSKQSLGNFIPDRAFAASLTTRLSTKYGPPQINQLPDGPASWTFLEKYLVAENWPVNRTTESLSVIVQPGYNAPVFLVMKMMDFRILRRDVERANSGPRSHAEGDVKF